MSTPDWEDLERRLDPRLFAVFSQFAPPPMADVASRGEALAQAGSEAGRRAGAAAAAFLARSGDLHLPAFDRLEARTETLASSPGGAAFQVQLIRPRGEEPLACIAYIHGGGMQVLSAFDPNYQAWGKLVASCGVAVVMVEFRNALRPSAVREVAPYPAGLEDCVSALRWAHDNAAALGVDPARLVVAGDSGGANLAIASALRLLREGDIGRIAGVYALAPFIAGSWPAAEHPSSDEFEGLFIRLHHNRHWMTYGAEAYAARDPLAWPGFATEDDLRGLPPVAINVNECDPLRDEGVAFYRRLLRSGVRARCRQSMGTVHATEVFPAWCPEISRSAALDLAGFARQPG